MNKEEFLAELRKALAGLPQDDVDDRLSFYDEMIDDRIEEGAGESDAVAGVGTVEEIAAQTLAEIPLQKLVRERIRPKRTLRAWEIVLIVLGFPVWLPLLIAAFAVVLALYAVVWALIVSLWAIEASLAACALGGVAAAVVFFAGGHAPTALAALGAGLVCAGLAIFMFFGCREASKGILRLTKKALVGVKSLFLRKENEK